ncbi:myrosinase 1-like isoform X2 [Leptidea sinapis]|uniref:myrosinase 1-like isoform X1 n=1 Tax=Leptidea sinapis TaxID=189913 RepID=UPI00214643AB|nr:myrosinase 1-like isoform X1 [Leptidea sinapis]XP_050670552.1 myrosinase 1-like isoform X2 [Leptidea sinapis]
MFRFVTFTLLIVALTDSKKIDNSRHEVRRFPDSLLFGTATASYQVEGAWNEDGKSENIWDRLTHTQPCLVKNCDTGDIADNSYYNYRRDVEMMRELGLDFYRFSLSWSRVLPTSFPDQINEAGVNYYNNLINEMLKYNIQPMITLYHWDLPQKLQELGGWANPHIVDWFSDYSRVMFELFGDRVKYWFTINEPRDVCYQGYAGQSMAPAYNISGMAEYLCAKNLLVAHAKVYHMYNEEYRPTQGGLVGIVLSASWFEPENEGDEEAAEELRQFEWGSFAHPIFSESGDFPPVMKEKIAAKSAAQGFLRSRLPEFTSEEIDLIKGSSDFFGLNHYTTNLVYRNDTVNGMYSSVSYYDDIEVGFYQSTEWPETGATWLKMVPWGFYKLLTKIREDYNNPPVFITENGCASREGLDDDTRVTYYKSYLDVMLDAIEDGSDVRVYTAWSLMDNFEWLEGYYDRFGLYEVDYESSERTRTPRKSAFLYKEILRTRTLDMHFEPDATLPMTIDEGH